MGFQDGTIGGKPVNERGRACLRIVRLLHDEAGRISDEVCGDAFFPAALEGAGSRPAFVRGWIRFMESISPEFIEVPPKPSGFEQSEMEWAWYFALELNTPDMYCVPDPVSFFDGFHRVAYITQEMGDKIIALGAIPR